MDSMDVTKASTAVLVAGIAFFLTGWLGDGLVHSVKLAHPAIKIEVKEAAAPTAAPQELPPIGALLAKADPEAGGGYAKKVCASCHSFNEGGQAGVGPNLYGVVGGPPAHMAGFNYSEALKGKKDPWTFANLNKWLYKPAAYAQGTRMAFAGISNAQDRANVEAYLRTLSHSPEPLPPVEEASAPAAAAAATPADVTIGTLLASADPARGKADTLKYACIACHSFNEGGKAGVGPNLYGVVGGPQAHMEGFAYSAGMKAKGGKWTYEELNKWLTNPAAYSPGTKMLLAGVTNAGDRADLIAYLRSLAATPEPLPAK